MVYKTIYEPSSEKTNIMASAQCIDPDQPAQSAQTDPSRHNPSQGGKRYRVMIPETENPRGMLRMIRVDTLSRVHDVGFLAGWLNCYIYDE